LDDRVCKIKAFCYFVCSLVVTGLKAGEVVLRVIDEGVRLARRMTRAEPL
jgi:hypothetical protein